MAAFRAQLRPGARPGEVDTRRGRGRAICRCAAQPSMPPPLPHRDRTPRDVPSRARARAHALISCAAVRLARPERAGLRPGGAPRVPLEIAPLTASLSARVTRQVAPPRHAHIVGARAPEAASGRDDARAHALTAPWPLALVPTHPPGPPRAARTVCTSCITDRLSSNRPAGRAPVREIESRAISRDLGVGVDYLARFSSYGMYTDLVYYSDRCLEHFAKSTPGHPTELPPSPASRVVLNPDG